MDTVDRKIINHLQDGLPVCERPYADAARDLGLEEAELRERLQRLLDEGYLSRFGPMYNAERLGGALTLAAMEVPEADVEHIAEQVNALPEVAHNYLRDHKLNMWFVLATETPEGVRRAIEQIESQTGLRVYDMPKLDEFFVGLRLEV